MTQDGTPPTAGKDVSVQVLVSGAMLFTGGFSLGLSTIALVDGDDLTLVDTGHGGHLRALHGAFEEVGITPADVTRVIVTHLHWDHMLNLHLFPGAEVVVHEREVTAARTAEPPDPARPPYAADILDRCRLRLVRGDEPIGRGLRVIETPGHSPGHLSVLAEVGKETVAITGDALPDRRTVLESRYTGPAVDRDRAWRSVELLLGTADIVVPGHDQPFRVGDGAPTYLDEPPRLTIGAEPYGADVRLLAWSGPPGLSLAPDDDPGPEPASGPDRSTR